MSVFKFKSLTSKSVEMTLNDRQIATLYKVQTKGGETFWSIKDYVGRMISHNSQNLFDFHTAKRLAIAYVGRQAEKSIAA